MPKQTIKAPLEECFRTASETAREALGAIYGTYTEGFTTPNLVESKALLEE